MSGPGLNQRDAHHAIHQAAFHDAERLTLLLRQSLRAGDQQQALQIAAVLIEQWQTRTLRHAEAEETGWYRDLVAERPELHDDVIALTRDHDLLRILLTEIQGILSARGIAAGVVERFEAMLLLNGIHSRTEEQRLLSDADEHVDEHTREAPYVDGDSRHALPAVASTSEAAGRDESVTAPLPLAIARPALYARLSALLRERGLNPADILAELRAGTAGQAILYVAFGQGYQQTMEWPLPDDRDDHVDHVDRLSDESGDESSTTPAAEDTILRQIAEACERATQADYHTRMRTPG